jgi:hypothetical protein
METVKKKLIIEKLFETYNPFIKDHLKSIWLISVSALTILLVVTYFILHHYYKGEDQILLNKDQLSVITALITQNDSIKTTDAQKKLLINDYLSQNLPAKDTVVDHLLKTYGLNQLITVLPTYPIKIKSYFWLSGGWVLMEVVFWSLFGLIAALLYSVTTLRGFNEVMIREHVGKFFYTPFICIIIYLALNALMNSGSISLKGVGNGVIVLSFILGFFTRRAILLLVKIKDLILPKTQDVADSDNQIRNMYPNEIKGTVTISSLSKEIFEKIRKAIKITAERNGTPEDKDSYYLITESINKDSKFSFNSLLPGDYKVSCYVEVDSVKYGKEVTIPVKDSDLPFEIILDLVKIEEKPPVVTIEVNNPAGEAENPVKE